ncbi:hypothetical protein BJ322DRAFT_531350 [Thelephora terrestris]|uniref:Uncharacterized protein n=1 Tax=Thelephora terrestris TaxID=56493 RepID=A0A9P6LA27_9AGAM|nr:hypothetical protein BJ322DRAFT_531350 [Thelephora terrestris]
MRLPQEIIEDIIDCFADDRPMLVTCSLVAKAWSARSRHHLFDAVTLNKERAMRWCSAICPGPGGPSSLVRTLTLQQKCGSKWLETRFLDAISGHFSFQYVENLFIAWLDLNDFEPGSLVRHFAHYGSSLRSLQLSYLTADYSTLISFLQLFPNLEDLLIHTPELSDDNPPLQMSGTGSASHGWLKLLSFDSVSSPFISHLAGLNLRLSSISVYDCEFSHSFPLTNLLEASSVSLRHLEIEYVTFSQCANVSLMRCENLRDVIVGVFKEDSPPLLLFSLLSTLSSYRLAQLTIDFVAIPSPQWPEWKTIDFLLLQMTERCGLRQGPQVLLRIRLAAPGDIVDVRQLLPKYLDVGPVEMRINPRQPRGG